MKLKAILDSLDSVDDALKAAYTEKDGRFILNVEGYDPTEVEKLRTKNLELRAEKKNAVEERDALRQKYASLPDDFSVDEYHTLKDSAGGKIDQRLADQRARMTAEKDTAVKKLTEERDAERKRSTKLASENEISKALAEANITSPAMQKAVKAMFKDQVKVDYEGDDAIVTIESLPVVDKIKAWAGTDEGKYFVTAPANGGGGSGGQGTGGGLSYDKMSFTELARIQDKDPRAKAEVDKRTKIDTKPMR